MPEPRCWVLSLSGLGTVCDIIIVFIVTGEKPFAHSLCGAFCRVAQHELLRPIHAHRPGCRRGTQTWPDGEAATFQTDEARLGSHMSGSPAHLQALKLYRPSGWPGVRIFTLPAWPCKWQLTGSQGPHLENRTNKTCLMWGCEDWRQCLGGAFLRT